MDIGTNQDTGDHSDSRHNQDWWHKTVDRKNKKSYSNMVSEKTYPIWKGDSNQISTWIPISI